MESIYLQYNLTPEFDLESYKERHPKRFKNFLNSYREILNDIKKIDQPPPIEIEMITQYQPILMLAFNEDDDFVGMVRYSMVFDYYKYKDKGLGKFYFIDSMVISEKYRGKGLCSKILQNLIAKIKTKEWNNFVLAVKEDNIPAIKCYNRVGFETLDKENGVMVMYKKL